MQGIEILLVSVLVAFSQGTNSSQFPNWQSSWISGGSVAAPGEFPYLVSLRTFYLNNHICGGSIISNWYVLTAAHCVIKDPAASIIVVAGTNTPKNGGQKYELSRIITHPGFNEKGAVNDIALLKLMQPVSYSQTVQPIALPSQDEIADLGTVCNFGGWGLTSENGALSRNLLKLQVSIVSSIECQKYNSYFSDTKLCARAPPGMGPCRGDSGGPLICGGQQIGVNIGGGTNDTNCKANYPLDYVYVSKYINWIKQNAV